MATVIAYGTDRQSYFDLFLASCQRHGIAPVLLGWGTKWVGFGKKTTDTRDYLAGLPDDEVVLSVDPFDVIFLGGLAEIEEKFRRGGVRFLCGALSLRGFLRRVYEREFNRSGSPVPHNPTGYDYLNSGTWISTAGYARRLIDRLVRDFGMGPTDMDQAILTKLYGGDRGVVDIDWRCEIFHNLLFKSFLTRQPDLKHLTWDDGRVVNTATGTRPSLLHASGNARMEGIAARLGFPADCSHPFQASKSFLRKAVFHVAQLLGDARPRRPLPLPTPPAFRPEAFARPRNEHPPGPA